jgi:hypothetical protein
MLYIANQSDLAGATIGSPNVFQQAEVEVAVNLKPIDFAERASVKITAQQARGILKEMGFDIPASIKTTAGVNDLLKRLPKLNETQINTFYQKAVKLSSGN